MIWKIWSVLPSVSSRSDSRHFWLFLRIAHKPVDHVKPHLKTQTSVVLPSTRTPQAAADASENETPPPSQSSWAHILPQDVHEVFRGNSAGFRGNKILHKSEKFSRPMTFRNTGTHLLALISFAAKYSSLHVN